MAVMAGLVPAIHVVSCAEARKDVDARHKAGHDERWPTACVQPSCDDPLDRRMNTQLLIQLLVNGLVVGTLYGVVAMSFVLIYKATQVVNFAQGELLLI